MCTRSPRGCPLSRHSRPRLVHPAVGSGLATLRFCAGAAHRTLRSSVKGSRGGGPGTTAALSRSDVMGGPASLSTGCDAIDRFAAETKGRTTPGDGPDVNSERDGDGARRGRPFRGVGAFGIPVLGSRARRPPGQVAPDRAGRPERRRAVRAVPRRHGRAAPGPVLLGTPAGDRPTAPASNSPSEVDLDPLLGLQGVCGRLCHALNGLDDGECPGARSACSSVGPKRCR